MATKKQMWKRTDKKCCFCGESDYDLLDSHRVLPGSEGGKYRRGNSLTTCSNCHRKIHSGRIVVLGKHLSSAGMVVIYLEDGREKIAPI